MSLPWWRRKDILGGGGDFQGEKEESAPCMLLAPAGQEGRGGWFTFLACLLACCYFLKASLTFPLHLSLPSSLALDRRKAGHMFF